MRSGFKLTLGAMSVAAAIGYLAYAAPLAVGNTTCQLTKPLLTHQV